MPMFVCFLFLETIKLGIYFRKMNSEPPIAPPAHYVAATE